MRLIEAIGKLSMEIFVVVAWTLPEIRVVMFKHYFLAGAAHTVWVFLTHQLEPLGKGR
jgi:hypothetical protein